MEWEVSNQTELSASNSDKNHQHKHSSMSVLCSEGTYPLIVRFFLLFHWIKVMEVLGVFLYYYCAQVMCGKEQRNRPIDL